MPFTGPFPKKDALNHAAFRAAEIRRQGGGFKGAKANPDSGFKAMRDDSTMDPFPKLKSRDDTGSHGSTKHTPAGDSDLPMKKKARPFGGYASPTPPPKGRALPHRGEHNS